MERVYVSSRTARSNYPLGPVSPFYIQKCTILGISLDRFVIVMPPSDLQKLVARLPMGDDPFSMVYRGARELEAAEKSQDSARLKELDFGVAPQACFRI